MKYYYCIIKFRAYNFIYEECFSAKENFTMEKAKKIIHKRFAETSVVISVKIAGEIIENENFSQFEIVGKISSKLINHGSNKKPNR